MIIRPCNNDKAGRLTLLLPGLLSGSERPYTWRPLDLTRRSVTTYPLCSVFVPGALSPLPRLPLV
jgi:hypothetical protein